MSYWVAGAFVALGALHIPPAFGALSPKALEALYGAGAADVGVRVLLQHRGAMFVLVAVACLIAAGVPKVRPAVFVLTAWSVLSYLAVYLAAGAPAGPLQRIALADLLAVPVLVFVAIAVWPTVALK